MCVCLCVSGHVCECVIRHAFMALGKYTLVRIAFVCTGVGI